MRLNWLCIKSSSDRFRGIDNGMIVGGTVVVRHWILFSECFLSIPAGLDKYDILLLTMKLSIERAQLRGNIGTPLIVTSTKPSSTLSLHQIVTIHCQWWSCRYNDFLYSPLSLSPIVCNPRPFSPLYLSKRHHTTYVIYMRNHPRSGGDVLRYFQFLSFAILLIRSDSDIGVSLTSCSFTMNAFGIFLADFPVSVCGHLEIKKYLKLYLKSFSDCHALRFLRCTEVTIVRTSF